MFEIANLMSLVINSFYIIYRNVQFTNSKIFRRVIQCTKTIIDFLCLPFFLLMKIEIDLSFIETHTDIIFSERQRLVI